MEYEPDFEDFDNNESRSEEQTSEEFQVFRKKENKNNSEFNINHNINQVPIDDNETDISTLRKNNAIIRRELMFLRRTIEKTENQKNRTQQLQNLFAAKSKELDDLKIEDRTLQQQLRGAEKSDEKKEEDINPDTIAQIRKLKEKIRQRDKLNTDIEQQLRLIDRGNIRIEEEIKLIKLRNEHLSYSLYIKLGKDLAEAELREIYDSKYKIPSNPPKQIPVSKEKIQHDPHTSPKRSQDQLRPRIQQQAKSQPHLPQPSALSELHTKEIEIQQLKKKQDEIAKQKEKQFLQLQKLFTDVKSKNKDIEFQISEREKQIKDKEREKELLLKQIALLVNKKDVIQDASQIQITKKDQKVSKINQDDPNDIASDDEEDEDN